MHTHKPLIAVTGSVMENSFSWDWWSWRCIRIALDLAGARYRRLTAESDPFEYDGLLLAGGVDITPSFYGQKNTASHRCQVERDELELKLLKFAMEQKKPVLGICRGAQLLNVGRGGTLHQEADKVFRYYVPAKTVIGKIVLRKASYISGSQWLGGIFKPDEKQHITSLHHQAIDRLGEGLVRIADDHHGMTQAIEGPGDTFMVGVQWHPEFQLYSSKQRGIFKAFVEACSQSSL